MERPEVNRGDWIILRHSEDDPGIEAHVFKEEDDGTLYVGYHAYSIRTTKAHAVWDETFWRVKQRQN